mmetsp:Transcript_16588/g.25066  ORF Transcript_16588/g.25066 Transcript_16588/m.25066 type:complete len:134 (+) Transcript_16588:317-718(+)
MLFWWRIHQRMYKKQHQLELRVEVEGVAEEGVEGEEDLCGGRVTLRSLLENNIIGLGVMILYTGDLMKRSLKTKHYTIYSHLDGRILTENNFVREHQRLKSKEAEENVVWKDDRRMHNNLTLQDKREQNSQSS